MIGAVFRTMMLRLVRDPGALLLAVALPPLIYIVFAAIFTTATSGDLDLRVAVWDSNNSELADEVLQNLRQESSLTLRDNPAWRPGDVLERVRMGIDDVGLLLDADLDTAGPGAVTVVEARGRDVAAQVFRSKLADAFQRTEGSSESAPGFRREVVGGDVGPDDPTVAYYVGAVAILFVLFSTLQSAAIVIEERRNGITARILSGQRGAMHITLGRFLFLVVLGLVQVAAICAVAAISFDVPILENMCAITLVSISLATFAAGFALVVASFCRSASQLHAMSTFAVLVLSAIGGAMVPRFMMPRWLQDISEATPVGWIIDMFYGILARSQTLAELWPLWSITLATGVLLTIGSAVISQRLGRV